MAYNNEMDLYIAKLLKRTPLTADFRFFLEDVNTKLPELGVILSVQPIMEGYEDANFILHTKEGKFVLKVFSKGRSEAVIQDYKNVLIALKKAKIPTLDLIGHKEHLFNYSNDGIMVWYFVTRFFDGFNFSLRQPYVYDLEETATILAKINNLQIKVTSDYDSWRNKNLLTEYKASYEQLSAEVKKLVNPVIQKLQEIDFTLFSDSLIHGDMQRKHVLRNNMKQYCVIDFGSMAYDKRVYDLSTYLAWFVYDESNMMRKDELFDIVLHSYTKIVPLNKYELDSLDTLTHASYASYYLKTWLLKANGDTSLETNAWHEVSKRMLRFFK